MSKFLKEIMRPGSYEWGTITPEDCQDFFAGVGDVYRAGLAVPVVLEHPPEKDNQLEGVPLPRRLSDPDAIWQEEVKKLRGTVGDVDFDDPRCRINEAGGVDLVLNIPDDKTADQMRRGLLKFVSPELRPGWYDARSKRKFGRLMSHIAVTQRPRQRDQRLGFVRLSELDDSFPLPALDSQSGFTELTEPAIMAKTLKLSEDDADPTKPDVNDPEKIKSPTENPDMPASPVKDQQLEAIIAHFAQMGLVLPADTTKDNFFDRILSAVMTFNAAKDKAEADNKEEPINAAEDTNTAAMQFSEASPQGKLVARINKAGSKIPASIRAAFLAGVKSLKFSEAGEEITPAGAMAVSSLLAGFEALPEPTRQLSENSPQSAIVLRIKKLEDENRITPGIADSLRGQVATMQLSENGQPAGELPAVVAHYEKSAAMLSHVLGDKTSAYQMSESGSQPAAGDLPPALSNPSHPGGAEFYKGEDAKVIPVGDPRAKEIAADLIRASGMGGPQPATELSKASGFAHRRLVKAG